MHIQPRTSWAKPNNPYTNKVPMKEVPVPKIVKPRKGHTKYDDEFEKLLEFKTAIESTEDGFEVLRRAMQRFLEYQNLKETISIRRSMDRQTRMVTLWLEPKEKK